MRIKRMFVVVVLAGAGMFAALPAASAQASDCEQGYFCAYRTGPFGRQLVAKTNGGAGTRVDADRVGFADNQSNHIWYGIKQRPFLPPSRVIALHPGDSAHVVDIHYFEAG